MKIIGQILHGGHSIIKPIILLIPVITYYRGLFYKYPGFGKRIVYTHNRDQLFFQYFDPMDPQAYHYHSWPAKEEEIVCASPK